MTKTNSNYDPNNDSNLTPVKLVELVDSDRIIQPDGEIELCREKLMKVGYDITFYVNKETNLALPLKMLLFTNRGDTLIPNQPVASLGYEQDGFMASLPQFHALGVELSCGYEFNNIRNSSDEDEPYFPTSTWLENVPNSPSGWKNNEQGKPLEARIELKFDGDGRATRAITIVRYET
jgi:hypothetical protein